MSSTKRCENEKVLCSACLLGFHCRYDGKSIRDKQVMALTCEKILIPVCPEQLGGLPVPRIPSEIRGDQVISEEGVDVTVQFEKGARETLKLAELTGCKTAILKQRSPSCGSGQVYDGTFSGKVIAGEGITTRLLRESGVNVISEEDLE